MDVQFDPKFVAKLKSLDVRIRNSFFKALKLFQENPSDPVLHNKPLRKEWDGYRGINVLDAKNDYRAIYEEDEIAGGVVITFVAIGTQEELYR